jgi:hypothetical protein
MGLPPHVPRGVGSFGWPIRSRHHRPANRDFPGPVQEPAQVSPIPSLFLVIHRGRGARFDRLRIKYAVRLRDAIADERYRDMRSRRPFIYDGLDAEEEQGRREPGKNCVQDLYSPKPSACTVTDADATNGIMPLSARPSHFHRMQRMAKGLRQWYRRDVAVLSDFSFNGR